MCKISGQAISESLQVSVRITRSQSQLVDQELTVHPEANIQTNVPEGLDLYKVIYEAESDSDDVMDHVDTVAGPNKTLSLKEVCKLFYIYWQILQRLNVIIAAP